MSPKWEIEKLNKCLKRFNKITNNRNRWKKKKDKNGKKITNEKRCKI